MHSKIITVAHAILTGNRKTKTISKENLVGIGAHLVLVYPIRPIYLSQIPPVYYLGVPVFKTNCFKA